MVQGQHHVLVEAKDTALQALDNVMTGKQWNDGLLQAMLLGGAVGGLGAAVGAVFAPIADEAAAGAAGALTSGADGEGAALDAAATDTAATYEAAAAGACSFSANTQVATPSGERAIANVHLGDTVLAYDPTTGKAEPELVQQFYPGSALGPATADIGTEGARAGRSVAKNHGRCHHPAALLHSPAACGTHVLTPAHLPAPPPPSGCANATYRPQATHATHNAHAAYAIYAIYAIYGAPSPANMRASCPVCVLAATRSRFRQER